MRKLGVAIPALNEEKSVETVVRAIPKDELNEMGFDVQILVMLLLQRELGGKEGSP